MAGIAAYLVLPAFTHTPDGQLNPGLAYKPGRQPGRSGLLCRTIGLAVVWLAVGIAAYLVLPAFTRPTVCLAA